MPSSRSPAGKRRPQGLRRHRLGFALRFGAAWTVGVLVVAALPGAERWSIAATVRSLKWMMGMFGRQFEASGATILIHGALPITIVSDCTSLMPTLTLWAAIIAFPTSLSWKLLGWLAGAALLWGFNLLRVAALAAIGSWPAQVFDFVHAYVWQTVTLVVVCVLFAGWIRYAPRS